MFLGYLLHAHSAALLQRRVSHTPFYAVLVLILFLTSVSLYHLELGGSKVPFPAVLDAEIFFPGLVLSLALLVQRARRQYDMSVSIITGWIRIMDCYISIPSATNCSCINSDGRIFHGSLSSSMGRAATNSRARRLYFVFSFYLTAFHKTARFCHSCSAYSGRNTCSQTSPCFRLRSC